MSFAQLLMAFSTLPKQAFRGDICQSPMGNGELSMIIFARGR